MKEVVQFYTKKYEKYGKKINAIGWSNKKDQITRFKKLFINISPKNKSILDVGCGFGDLYYYLKKNHKKNFNYTGIDITPDFATHAKKRLNFSNAKIYNCNISKLNKKFDIVVASGSLSYKFKGSKKYNLELIKKMFKKTNEVLSINFLSSYNTYQLNKNIHYKPEEMFTFAKQISPRVNIIHDYELYEFTLQIYK